MQATKDDKFISAAEADRLIAAHDGDVALLYLYIRRTGSADTEGAARALCRTLGEMDAALEKLERMGLLGETPAGTQKLPPTDKLPEDYRAADIVSRDDGTFTAIVQEAQRVLGHALSTPDLKKLFGIYDYLALPPEVIMVLLHHCVSVSNGRLPTMRFIEKEAFDWANREIRTLEQAEDYMEDRRLRGEESAAAARVLGITGRALSATEKRYITSWLDLGYTPELIAIAYDRTVTNTGALRWGYMNKIIQSWHEKGLFTAGDVEAKDGRRPSRAPGRAPDKPVDLSDLKSLLKSK
ncbi:MAG: DnaD domain protein [Oscillospiraceae bacterium]|nr:DnaD domain protein [Oscillospiraceae bacterium]